MERDRRSLEARIVAKASQDLEFRRELEADPKGAIARELGVTIPSSITVRIATENPNTIYLVLPAVGAAGRPIDESDHTSVGGGWHPLSGGSGSGDSSQFC
ncbi:MAG: NHLP leader peptide family RiPP precursor [Dehalococcoidia bacterium]